MVKQRPFFFIFYNSTIWTPTWEAIMSSILRAPTENSKVFAIWWYSSVQYKLIPCMMFWQTILKIFVWHSYLSFYSVLSISWIGSFLNDEKGKSKATSWRFKQSYLKVICFNRLNKSVKTTIFWHFCLWGFRPMICLSYVQLYLSLIIYKAHGLKIPKYDEKSAYHSEKEIAF